MKDSFPAEAQGRGESIMKVLETDAIMGDAGSQYIDIVLQIAVGTYVDSAEKIMADLAIIKSKYGMEINVPKN